MHDKWKSAVTIVAIIGGVIVSIFGDGFAGLLIVIAAIMTS